MSSTEPSVESTVGAATDGSAAPTRKLVGSLVAGRYRVEAILGEGAMGAVYRVEHVLMRKQLALKVLHPELSQNAEFVSRFEREAMAAAHIEHPNVAAATDFGRTEDGAFFLVLEYVEGTSLGATIRNSEIAPERAIAIARQIALALVRAHELGLVHRDLKPDNIMLVDRGEARDVVKVLDFGIAKASDGVFARNANKPFEVLTRAGAIYGTPEYMSPEQALGEAVDARSDLYAVGVILYEMLTGMLPFADGDTTRLLGQILTSTVPPLSVRAPSRVVPPLVESVVMCLLEKQASKRYASARDVVEALDSAAAASGIGTSARARTSAGRVAKASPPRFASSPSPSQRLATAAAESLASNRRRTISSRSVVVAGCGVVALVGSVFAMSLVGRAHNIAGSASAASHGPAPRVANATEDEVARATREGAEALEALAVAHPTDARIPRALYSAYAEAHRPVDALRVIARLVELEKSAASEQGVVAAVTSAALSGGTGADAAFALLEGERPMNEQGVDILYEIATRGGPSPGKTRALLSLAKPAVRAHATPATLVALEVREAKGCAARRALLKRARDVGDARTLAALRPLTATRGCGFLGLGNCHKCLHADGALRDAITAIESRVR
jgi:eukaryotic-like serine/threonine-protein kinase